MLHINPYLIKRDIDQCYFDGIAFKAHILNPLAFNLVSYIEATGGCSVSRMLSLAKTPAQERVIGLFLDKCLSEGILFKAAKSL